MVFCSPCCAGIMGGGPSKEPLKALAKNADPAWLIKQRWYVAACTPTAFDPEPHDAVEQYTFTDEAEKEFKVFNTFTNEPEKEFKVFSHFLDLPLWVSNCLIKNIPLCHPSNS